MLNLPSSRRPASAGPSAKAAPPARRPWPAWRKPDSYGVACAVVGLWAVLLVWQHRWGADIRLHYATLYALERDVWHPGDPMVGGPSAGPYFSPYMLVLALIARAGVSATAVFGLAALVNTALLLWGFRRFAGQLSAKPRVAALGLGFTLLLWGWSSYGWSGLLDLRSVGTELPYPSMFGLALMFFIWDAMLRYRAAGQGGQAGQAGQAEQTDQAGQVAPRRAARFRLLAVLTLLGALLVLSHPFTAVNTAVGVAAFAVARPSAWRRADLVGLGLAAAMVIALVLAWPYSDLTALFGGSAEFTLIHRPLMRGAVERYGLALIGLPALLLGLRRPLGRELLLLFLGGAALVGYAWFAGQYAFARALPIYGLPLQLALARHLADRQPGSAPGSAPDSEPGSAPDSEPDPRAGSVRTRTWWWRGYAAVTALGVAAGSLGGLAGVLPVIPGRVDLGTPQWRIASGNPDDRWSLLTRHLRQGEVVMAGPQTAGIVNRYGMYSVAPAWPDPFIPDEAARRAGSRKFFAATTPPQDRLGLADRYRVRCLIAQVPFDPLGYPTFHQVAAAPRGWVLACRGPLPRPGAAGT